VKNDHTLLLVSGSVATFVLSIFLLPFSIHTYCENRVIAAIFGVIAVTLFLLLFRGKPETTLQRVMSVVARVMCILAVAVNVAFIIYATHLCRHMFDQLQQN
jgi:hypothetical protein